MPDRGGPRALHRLCDSVNGANWRPTLFEDELTVNQYACRVCHVIPGTTVLLPCSHILCEHCVTGCVVQDGGNVCPLDAQPFCEDECQKLKLPAKTKHNLKAHCWNEADGCQFVGPIEAVLLHFDRECAFHALQCRRCEQRILRTDIAAHYVAGCSQSASCASGHQPSTQDSAFTTGYENAMLEKQPAIQGAMIELSRSKDSANFDDISRGMKGIESNIISVMTQQLNSGLEEVKMLVRDPLSNQLSSLQSQMNELVEQSRHQDISDMQEVVCKIRDSQNELKQDVQATSHLMGHSLSDNESKFKESLTAQLQEFVHALKASECEMKERVSKVEANLCSKITEQQQSPQRALDSHNNVSTETERPLAAAASGKEEIPLNMQEGLIPLKLEMFVHETLKTMEFLRQQINRQEKELWVSNITNDWDIHEIMWKNVSTKSNFSVTLINVESVSRAEKRVFTYANLVKYRDMHIRITFESFRVLLMIDVECVKTLGNSSFPFNKITVEALGSHSRGRLVPEECWQMKCLACSEKNLSHFTTRLRVNKKKLAEDGFIKDGELKLLICFE